MRKMIPSNLDNFVSPIVKKMQTKGFDIVLAAAGYGDTGPAWKAPGVIFSYTYAPRIVLLLKYLEDDAKTNPMYLGDEGEVLSKTIVKWECGVSAMDDELVYILWPNTTNWIVLKEEPTKELWGRLDKILDKLPNAEIIIKDKFNEGSRRLEK